MKSNNIKYKIANMKSNNIKYKIRELAYHNGKLAFDCLFSDVFDTIESARIRIQELKIYDEIHSSFYDYLYIVEVEIC